MKILFFASLMLFTQMSLAQIDRKGNGGDICEDRIKIIRDDIASWIKKGGSAGLRLSTGVSVDQYNSKMLVQIANAEISCVDTEVLIAGVEKTCTNFPGDNGTAKIICNQQRFLSTNESDQYVLVHHEYAGLTGLEVNDGASSHYVISNQISGYLEYEVVKKLAVKAPPSNVDINKNPYQVLKDAFSSAGPVREANLPSLPSMMSDKPPLKCFAVDVSGDVSQDYTFGVVKIITPPHGPLLPGGETDEVAPMMYWSGDGDNSGWSDYFGPSLNTGVNGSGDLESTWIPCKDFSVQTIFRKQGNMIFIHMSGTLLEGEGAFACGAPTKVAIDRYGYCFPTSK